MSTTTTTPCALCGAASMQPLPEGIAAHVCRECYDVLAAGDRQRNAVRRALSLARGALGFALLGLLAVSCRTEQEPEEVGVIIPIDEPAPDVVVLRGSVVWAERGVINRLPADLAVVRRR